MRLGNGNESDSSAPTIRLATLIRGARTAAGGERARILGVGASTAASTPGDVLGSARGRHLICARAHLLRRAPRLATTWPSLQTVTPDSIEEPPHRRYIPIHYLLHTHWLHALECAEPNAAPSQSSRQPSLEGARANHDLTGLVTRQDDNHRPVEPGTPDTDRNHATRERDGYRVGTSAACSPITCTF